MKNKDDHMNLLKLIAGSLALISFPAISFAFFCPSNFNQIDFGMTMDQVTEACGKPDKQTETKKENDNVPQEWNYYLKQAVSTGNRSQTMEGTLKTSFAFDENGKLMNMSVNGIGVGATDICGKSLQLGATRDEVKAACGEAAFVNKQPPPAGSGQQDTKIVEFLYSSANPPVTLVFESGLLTSKK
jgi:hypothetical protein